jgi:hypothetical protein
MLDRRCTPRLRTYKIAQVVFNGRWSTYDCLIRNLSGKGACLQIASTAGIPTTFRMMFLPEKSEQTCNMIWRSKDHIGVAFKHAA